MKSLIDLYRTGMGPSSSHTMGPRRAAGIFAQQNPGASSFRVTLQGSLAATGKGHLTDVAVLDALGKPCDLIWEPEHIPSFHPNGMKFEALDADGGLLAAWQVYSVGGGQLKQQGKDDAESPDIYPAKSAADLLDWCADTGKPLWRYVEDYEAQAGNDIDSYLKSVWRTMSDSIKRGLKSEEPLPGEIRLKRRAHAAFLQCKRLDDSACRTAKLAAYALAVAEENGSGGVVCTAPTCGSSGVIPGTFRYLQEKLELEEIDVIRALETAGLFGNLIKHNASISGAEVGCQGEIGAACAMAAAGAAQMLGASVYQIEAAAEMGLEHHLGLTCDPVGGLVQIPCIERNAMAAIRALDCAEYSLLFDGRHYVSFDQVVETMRQTGNDLPSLYKETSAGGLAVTYSKDKKN